jgi:BirA family biotin operon repressor/biotin-[acetyl-CoA-carboxylase] ligase
MVSEEGSRAGSSAACALKNLDTQLVGRKLIYLSEVPSTNDEARRLADEGTPDGTVVAADHQTAGRGRQGRRWIAPPGSSLLFSILFRPMLQPQQAQRLTMICGLAVLDALLENVGVRADLKWPNDILFREQKLGGILAELHASGNRIDYVVVGIGLNVNLDPMHLPKGLLVPATSLSAILGRPVSQIPLLGAVLRAVDRRYVFHTRNGLNAS